MSAHEGKLRGTFDDVALLYDQARPGYPAALFDDVVALSGIPSGGRILEIGCGTGQATLPLARRGYQIVCVELGAHLAAVARRNLAPYPRAQVHVGTFETWPVDAGAFDLTLAATSFHWVDPAVRYTQAAHALKPGGAIALFWSHHVRGATDTGFFDAVQLIYERETPELTEQDSRLLTAAEFGAPEKAAIEQSGLFGEVAVRGYEWEVTYTATTYIDVLNTYSGHRLLPDARRARLFHAIAELIDTQYGGHITKGYLTNLYVAPRR
jgi:SAM-dependent methyltransferase